MSHRVLIMDLVIRLHAAFSLKDKRKLRLSLIDTLKRRYNISIAETQYHDTLNTCGLTLSYVALNEATALQMEGTLRDAIDDLLDASGEGELIDLWTRIV